MMSPFSTWSPSPNIHSSRVISVALIPSLGMRISDAIVSRPSDAGLDRFDDLRLRGNPRLFQNGGERDCGECPADPQHRTLELVPALFLDVGGDLRAGAERAHRFVQRDR